MDQEEVKLEKSADSPTSVLADDVRSPLLPALSRLVSTVAVISFLVICCCS